jgi:hypothetical protein
MPVIDPILFVGMTEQAAREAAEANGLRFRVIEEDGQTIPYTADHRPDRLNVALVEGKVVGADLG